jgi:hypothetical protein
LGFGSLTTTIYTNTIYDKRRRWGFRGDMEGCERGGLTECMVETFAETNFVPVAEAVDDERLSGIMLAYK